jgi:uncharacterized protein (TIGR03437 family)
VRTPFRPIALIGLALLVALGTFDTASAQNTINLTPTTLVFCVATNSSQSPPSQNLTVSAANGAGPQDYVASATQPWILLNSQATPPSISGNTAGSPNISVQIDPSGYATGTTHTGQVQVSAGTTGSGTANVTINVSNSCANGSGTMNANPSTVSLSLNLTSQEVQIGGAPGSTTAVPNYGTGPNGWFVLDNSSFNSPSFNFNISLPATPSNVSYSGSVTVTVNGTTNSITITVNYNGGATGNGAFTATPPSITKNFTSNQDPVFDTVVSIGAGSVTGHAVSANISLGNGPGNWITVPVSPGTVPTSATIRIDPTNLVIGSTYSGSVIFVDNTNAANFVTVPVSASFAAPYSANPNPLNFSIPIGTVGQVQQNLTITGPNVPVAASVQAGHGPAGWFIVAPSSANIVNGGLMLTVTVNTGLLTAGVQYQGSVVITQGGNQVLSVPVNAIVGGTSTLTVTPSQLNFAYQSGSNIQPQQTINVSSGVGTQVNFSVLATTSSCGNGWIVPAIGGSTTNGTSPVGINIFINTANLPLGNCSGNVAISSTGNATFNVGVNLLVTTNPVLTATPSSLNFAFQPGGATPQSQSVSLSSSSSTQLNFTTSVSSVLGTPVFATVNQNSGSTPFSLGIGINSSVLSLLGPGTYVNNVVITSNNAGNSPVAVQVTLVVSGNATLTANPSSLALNYQIGQVQPPNQSVIISSTGTALQFNTTAISSNCGSFLGVSPASGTTTPSVGQNGALIVVTATMSGITTPQVCSGTVTVSSVNSSTSVTIHVTVTVVNTAVIDIGVSAVTQIATSTNGQFNVSVPLTASDSATAIPFNANVVTNPPGQIWVSVFPQSGSTASNLNVQLFPTGLPTGTYNATLNVNDTRQGSAVPNQSIPITLIVAGQATATPSSLTFALPQGGTVANQTIAVGNVPNGATIGAGAATFSCGTGWIGTSVTGNSVSVGITGSSFTVAQSPCTGQVSIVVPGASNSPLNVGVTVNITNPVSVTATPSNLSFTYAAGSNSFPQNQTAQLGTSNASAVAYSISATSANGGNFFSVTPSSGNTPQTLTISVNQAVVGALAQGTYTGTATISSGNLQSAVVNVTLTVTASPPPALNTVVNAATQQPGAISPGEIISIYGTNVGPTTPASLTLVNGSVSTNIGNTQVFFDTIAAPLIYVSATQVNLIVPYEMAGRFQTTMTITRGGVTSNAVQLRVTDTAPGIFTANASGQGQGAILNQNNSFNGPGSAAPKGTVIAIYATGEGTLNPPGVTGMVTSTFAPFPKPAANVSLVFVVPGPGGTTVNVPATITYAGEAPALVSGVLQVNAVVPASVPSGANTIVLTVGANSSPTVVTVQVQ